MSELIDQLLVEREFLIQQEIVVKENLKDINQKVEAVLFPTEILDYPQVVTANGITYQAVLNSKLEWNQGELSNLMLDTTCAGKIKEKLSVDRV